MATSYDPIFAKFIKKIKNDDQFFNYKGLTDEEIENIVNDHLNGLLDLSVSYIYKFGNPDINLYDKNDLTQEFGGDLVNQETDLLSDLMFTTYVQEQRNRIKAFGLTFRSAELNVFSPSNERKTTLDMINDLEDKVENSIQNYLARDRITWEYKSIYSGSS